MLRHFALRIDLDDKVYMSWGIIICSRCVWPEEVLAICVCCLERDVLPDWQA